MLLAIVISKPGDASTCMHQLIIDSGNDLFPVRQLVEDVNLLSIGHTETIFVQFDSKYNNVTWSRP